MPSCGPPWRDRLAEIEVSGDWVDEWLENPAEYRCAAVEDGTVAHSGVSRVKIGGTGLRRFGQALSPK